MLLSSEYEFFLNLDRREGMLKPRPPSRDPAGGLTTGQGAHKRASAYHMSPKNACIQCGRLPICSGTYPSVPY